MLNFNALSYWEKIAVTESIDFLIVGAGLVGTGTAIALRKRYPDARIVVLERGYLPTGASTKNAGFTCFGSASELVDDLSRMDENTVWETVQLRYEGLQLLLSTYGSENLGYERSGSWDLIHTDHREAEKPTRDSLQELNARIFSITGEKDCFSETPDAATEKGFQHIATSFHNRLEGEIRTNQLVHALQHQLAVHSITVLYGVAVSSIQTSENNVTVLTNFGELNAAKVAVTVNGFAQQLLNDQRILPARAQVVVTSPIPNLKFNGTYHYDAGYYYFRAVNGRILLGGGRNLDIAGETTTAFGNTDQITGALQRLLKEVIIPGHDFSIDYQWSGIMGVGTEKKPIIELIHPNIAIGVRMGGMGVAIGTLVGQKVAALF